MASDRTALDDAVRALGRRPLTELELRTKLLERGHGSVEIDEATERCVFRGWLDEAALARQYIDARAGRTGVGPWRLIAELVRRGVDESVAGRAWDSALEQGTVDLQQMLARRAKRRLAGRRRLSRSGWARVYNALLQEGFAADDVARALEPHASTPDRAEAPSAHGIDDDFA